MQLRGARGVSDHLLISPELVGPQLVPDVTNLLCVYCCRSTMTLTIGSASMLSSRLSTQYLQTSADTMAYLLLARNSSMGVKICTPVKRYRG